MGGVVIAPIDTDEREVCDYVWYEHEGACRCSGFDVVEAGGREYRVVFFSCSDDVDEGCGPFEWDTTICYNIGDDECEVVRRIVAERQRERPFPCY